MKAFHPALGAIVLAGLVASLAACNDELFTPSSAPSNGPVAGTVTVGDDHPSPDDLSGDDNLSALAGTLRLRCERRSSRSKISVDGNDLSPRNGRFRARVRAAGGTVTAAAKRAVGDEVEFDFDSNRNDIVAGATAIPANFIRARSGPDVVGQILNAEGVVVASQGVECSFR